LGLKKQNPPVTSAKLVTFVTARTDAIENRDVCSLDTDTEVFQQSIVPF